MTPGQKNLEISFIILDKQTETITKNNQKIFTFWIADETASIFLNLFNETGEALEIGDVVYLNGAYASLFKG